MHRRITDRDLARLEAEARAHRIAKMRRDHELELLLTAGVPLAEARELVA